MGLLVGLPMKLFHILFVILRFAWPLLILLLIYFLRRRKERRGGGRGSAAGGQDSQGPVVDVKYRVVEDEGPDKGG